MSVVKIVLPFRKGDCLVQQDIVHVKTMLENYVAIDPTVTPYWDGPTTYDTYTVAQIHAAVVGGVIQTDSYDQEDYFFNNTNVGYVIPTAVDYDPTTGIRTSTY